MASLFGATPQEVLYNQFKEDEKMQMLRNQQIAQEGGQFGVFAPLYQASRKFGEMGSQAITNSLFPQAENPELARAQKIQAVLSKYEGQDFSNLDTLSNVGRDFMVAGVPEAGLQVLKLRKDLAPDAATTNVQTAKVLPDGTTVLILRNGQRKVISAEGTEITDPKAQAQAVADAEKFGVTLTGQKGFSQKAGGLKAEAQYGASAEGAKAAGAQGIKLSGEALSSFNKISTQIGNLDDAIGALEKGAKSGYVYNKLPSITAASIELKNAANRLGLDVIGSVTFGALSEGELNLAMSTAVPLDMNEKDLKEYLIKKKAAQIKLRDYMRKQAEFLSKPGNTLNMWMEQKIERPTGSVSSGESKKPISVDY